MRKMILILTLVFTAQSVMGQKVDSIYFNLYTDSLKKGFYNYINIDGKMSDGSWSPLDSTQVLFLSDAGYFKGNDLYIDSSYTGETVRVKAVLKSNPNVKKEMVIYIRKRGFTEPLKTNEEILDEMRRKSKKSKERLS
jgi:hypothetical protein